MQTAKRGKSGSEGKISWTELYQDLTGVNLSFFTFDSKCIQRRASDALGSGVRIVQMKTLFSRWHYIVLSQIWPPLEAVTSNTVSQSAADQ